MFTFFGRRLIDSFIHSFTHSQEMKEVREKILVAERIVLQTIGFDLHISHPIGNCLEYLRALKSESQ